MTATLEQSYRRWWQWYPRWFRAEHGDEMLAVLLADAPRNRRRPELRDRLDLVRGALSLWLRPRVPRSETGTRLAIRLMMLGAGVELAVSLTVWATYGDVRANILARNPDYTSGQWHAEVAGSLEPLAIASGAFVLFWLWMAWANGRGRRWAKIVFSLLLLETTFSLLRGLKHGSAAYAPQDLVVGIALWLVELSAVIALAHGLLRSRAYAEELPA